MFDITAARRAILNHALQQLKMSAGDSDFDISTMLELLPRGGGNGRLRRILTALKQPDKPQHLACASACNRSITSKRFCWAISPMMMRKRASA